MPRFGHAWTPAGSQARDMLPADWLHHLFSGAELGSRVLAEKRIALDDAVPEYRVCAVLRAEFDEDGPRVQLVASWPCSGEVGFLDSAQVEATIQLLQRALPQLQQLEVAAEPAWDRWRSGGTG